MSRDLLTVQSISKRFQNQDAVLQLSFSVRKGEIFALLGPNGAGKTTTIRMLLGILKPDEGLIRFDRAEGGGPNLAPTRVGYLPEDRGLYRDIPILKTLVYMGVLHGLPRRQAHSLASSWLDRVGLKDRAHDKLETLSKGNQQKVQFISAVLHKPEFAVLDEPFSGLDPVNQEFFIEIIRELRHGGMTVLLCAHQMELVERLAERVLLLDRGREVLSGTLPEVRGHSGVSRKVVLKIPEGTDLSGLSQSSMVQKVEARGTGEYAFHIKQGAPLHSFLLEAARATELLDIHTERVSLHDIFVETVGRKDSTGPSEVAE